MPPLPAPGFFFFLFVTESREYLAQESSVAGGFGPDGQGLVDRVVSEQCLDCVTVFLDYGLIKSRVQCSD